MRDNHWVELIRCKVRLKRTRIRYSGSWNCGPVCYEGVISRSLPFFMLSALLAVKVYEMVLLSITPQPAWYCSCLISWGMCRLTDLVLRRELSSNAKVSEVRVTDPLPPSRMSKSEVVLLPVPSPAIIGQSGAPRLRALVGALASPIIIICNQHSYRDKDHFN